jgi:hypothetical protein
MKAFALKDASSPPYTGLLTFAARAQSVCYSRFHRYADNRNTLSSAYPVHDMSHRCVFWKRQVTKRTAESAFCASSAVNKWRYRIHRRAGDKARNDSFLFHNPEVLGMGNPLRQHSSSAEIASRTALGIDLENQRIVFPSHEEMPIFLI